MASQGKDTTEYKETRKAGVAGIVSLVLGAVIAAGPAVAGEDTTAGIIAGGAVAVAGTAQALLVRLGYIKSRTDVKAKGRKQ